MTTPTSAALDQFLRDSYDVVQAVHRRLDAITAVADHLTPVEDLVEFRHEVTALHNKLGLLVAASELIVRATEAGINLLLAPDPAAQRQLLGLRSAALYEASYFATQEAFLELQAWVTQLSARLDQAFAELAKKVDRDELDAILQPILDRLNDLEDGIDIGLDETNSRLTLLISRLEDGEYNRALATALELLTTRVEQTETGYLAEAQKLIALQSEVVDLTNQVAGNATAVNQLLTRVESSDEGIDALSQDYTRLSTEVENLATGQSANTEALQLLQSHTSTHGESIESHGLALTQLSGTINDVLHGTSLTADAISGLETRMTSNEAGQLALSTQYDQLASRVTDTETGIVAGATAHEQLLTRVEQTENALTIAAEDRTHLKASLTSTGNHLPNAGFAVDLRGWSLFARGDGWLDAQLERNLQPSQGTLPAGINALGLFQDEVPSGAAGVRSSRIPVEDLAGYLLSGYLAAENCTVRLEWRVLNAAGEEIDFGLAGSSSSPPSNRLSDWDRVHGPLDIPADGASVEVQWWVDDCHTGWPRAWLVRPMLEPRHGSQEAPSPWMEGVHGLEESFAEATQLLETRLTQTEESIEAVSRALTDLDVQLGTGQEWRIVNHAGSGDYVEVGSPLPPGLYRPGEETAEHIFERGLTLLRFGEDGNLATAERFDTFASVSERERLADTLGLLSMHDAFVLVSQDHHGVKLAGLTEVLEDCGALNYANLVGSRPYILAGRPGLGKGGGIEVAAPVARPWNDFILTLVNDTPQGLGGQSGVADLLVGQAGALQELQALVERNGEDMTAISQELVDLSARLDTSESGLSAQGTALQELTTEVSRIDGDVVSLSSSVTELNNVVYSQADGLATKASASAVAALESEVTGLGEDLVSASSAITSLENTLNHPSTGLSSKASSSALAQLDSRVSAVESSASDTTELEARLGTVEGSLIQEMITSATNDASHTSAINMMESRLDDPDTGLMATANGLSGLRTRVTTVEGKTESHATHLTNLQAQVNALDLDAGGSGQAIADLTTRVEEVEDGIESHGQAITALQNSVTSANKVYVQDAQPSTSGQTHGNLWIDSNDNNKLYAYNSATNKWELRQDAGKNTIFVQGTQPTARAVNDLWFDTSRNNRQFRWNGSAWVEVTDTRTAANASAITSLTNRVSSVEGTNTTQSQQITTLTNRINDSSTGLAASATAISDLKTRMTSAEGVNTSQGSAITSLENKVNHSTSGNSALASALSGLRTRVTATEGSLSSQASQISSLESKVNHGTTGLSATYNSVTSLSSTVNTLSGKVNTEASKLSSLTTTVNGHTSSITSHSGSINGMKSWHRVTLNSNGHISGTRSENDGTKSSFSVLATVFRVITSGSTGLEWQNGYLRAYSGSIQLVLGINFGRDSNLCFWYGPNVGASSCTKANGTIWFDNVGGAYFGGSLHAGVLRNAATSTQVSSRASVETGVFGTNGNQKIVTYSLSYSNGFTTSSNLGDTATITATIILERSYNGGSWTQVSSRNISGTRYFHGYEPGVGYTYNFQLSGSSSYTDNRTGTGTFNYRTRVTANSGWPFIAPSGFQGNQQLTVTSIEE